MGAGIVGEQHDPAGDIDIGSNVGPIDLNVAGQALSQHKDTEFTLHGIDRAAGCVDHEVCRIDAADGTGNDADPSLEQVNDNQAESITAAIGPVGELADAQDGAAFHAENSAITELERFTGKLTGA